MGLPHVTITAGGEDELAYIHLAERGPRESGESVRLQVRPKVMPVTDELDLVLDFDENGCLKGIEILGDAEKWLRPELLADAEVLVPIDEDR